MIHFLVSKLQVTEGSMIELVEKVKHFAFKKPAKKFLSGLGEMAIRDLLLVLNKDKTDPSKEVESIISKQIKGSTAFEEFYDIYEQIYLKNIHRRAAGSLSYNLQFLLHSLL